MAKHKQSATPKGAAPKVGAGSRRKARGKHTRQTARTAANKARRMRHQERLAGRRLIWRHARPETLAALNMLKGRP